MNTITLTSLQQYNIQPSHVVVSWYEYGSITANGEPYNNLGLTCASPNLPFNTILTLQANKKLIEVRVNDRGPFAVNNTGKAIYPLRPHPVRKLDLSKGAFQELFEELNIGVSTVQIIEVKFPKEEC